MSALSTAKGPKQLLLKHLSCMLSATLHTAVLARPRLVHGTVRTVALQTRVTRLTSVPYVAGGRKHSCLLPSEPYWTPFELFRLGSMDSGAD
jgi:hypothetical protein